MIGLTNCGDGQPLVKRRPPSPARLASAARRSTNTCDQTLTELPESHSSQRLLTRSDHDRWFSAEPVSTSSSIRSRDLASLPLDDSVGQAFAWLALEQPVIVP